MNLGGIKISCIEIEKSLNRVEGVIETAAIAVSPKGGGPSLLVIFAVMKDRQRADKLHIQQLMQESIKKTLNPLFRIHDLVFIDSLPRTASNKVMRRVLRAQYQANA
jgi:acetyl-CoA synthetase